MATEKQIQEWKKEHGSFYELQVEDKVCFLKPPDMLAWKRALSKVKKGFTSIEVTEEILKALWLGGDKEILEDDAYFLSIDEEIQEIIEYDPADVDYKQDNITITIGDHKAFLRSPSREDLKKVERRKSNNPFYKEENLFELLKIKADKAFEDRNNANIRMPLYKALGELENKKTNNIKKH